MKIAKLILLECAIYGAWALMFVLRNLVRGVCLATIAVLVLYAITSVARAQNLQVVNSWHEPAGIRLYHSASSGIPDIDLVCPANYALDYRVSEHVTGYAIFDLSTRVAGGSYGTPLGQGDYLMDLYTGYSYPVAPLVSAGRDEGDDWEIALTGAGLGAACAVLVVALRMFRSAGEAAS